MAYLAGKYARFTAGGVNVVGSYKWAIGFKRDRLDTTNFESAVSVSGNNVFSEGLTGIFDTTFSVDGYVNDALVNIFFPEAYITAALYYRKTVALGYAIPYADILSFSPNTTVRDKAGFSAEFQTSGLVSAATG